VRAAAADVDEVGEMLTARMGSARLQELEQLLEEVEDCLSEAA
jgi:hypothetical protein